MMRMAYVMLVFCVIGWPVSALTIAKEEPQVVLGLSWLALAYSAVTTIIAARIAKRQDKASPPQG